MESQPTSSSSFALRLSSELPAVFRRGLRSGPEATATELRTLQFSSGGPSARLELGPLERLAESIGRSGAGAKDLGNGRHWQASSSSAAPAGHQADSRSLLCEQFLKAVPDKGLELSSVWTAAQNWLQQNGALSSEPMEAKASQ
ncbi:unnamed protein product, partial [Polarella glacialis]